MRSQRFSNMKKILMVMFAMLLAAAVCTGCQLRSDAKESASDETLTEMKGTLDRSMGGRMENGERPELPEGGMPGMRNGERPEMPDGETPDMQNGERPEMPDGETPDMQNGERPERPDGETPDMQNGERPERPDGEGHGRHGEDGAAAQPGTDTPAQPGTDAPAQPSEGASSSLPDGDETADAEPVI